MRYLLRIALAVLIVAPVAARQTAATQSKNVPTMAGILLKLNHFASDADKTTLKAIVDDKAATAPEKTIAQALLNVQHKVSDADKPKLEALVKDTATPESIKTMAQVILNLNHTPSAAEKDTLKKIAG